MKQKALLITGLVLTVSLLGFSVYQNNFLPAPSPDKLEYLPISQQVNIGLAATAHAAEAVDSPNYDRNENNTIFFGKYHISGQYSGPSNTYRSIDG